MARLFPELLPPLLTACQGNEPGLRGVGAEGLGFAAACNPELMKQHYKVRMGW
jgi:hypothetical protein